MPFTYFLSGIIQPPSNAHSAKLRMYKKVDTVKHITFGIMCRKSVVTRYLGISVIVAKLVIIHNKRQGTSCNCSIDHQANLPFREYFNQFADVLLTPERSALPIRISFYHGR